MTTRKYFALWLAILSMVAGLCLGMVLEKNFTTPHAPKHLQALNQAKAYVLSTMIRADEQLCSDGNIVVVEVATGANTDHTRWANYMAYGYYIEPDGSHQLWQVKSYIGKLK